MAGSGIFYADASRLTDSVLTPASPTAFGFTSSNPAPITVDGSFLFVLGSDPANPPTLALVGGSIDVTNGAYLLASGGKLLLASAAWSGTGPFAEVTLPTAVMSPEIIGSATRLPITVSGGAILDAQDQFFAAEGRGGTVYIRGGPFTLDNSSISSFTTGSSNGNAVGIDIEVASMTATGAGTTVEAGVTTGLSDPATGKGGGVLIDATGGTVTVSDGALIQSSSTSIGTAGSLTVTSDTLNVNGGTIKTFVSGDGHMDPLLVDAEPLTINVGMLNVTNGGIIETSNDGVANGGVISVTATESFLLSGAGTDALTGIRGISGGGATGTTGNISVTAGSGSITNGAVISSGSVGSSPLGAILVDVTGTLSLSGFNSAATPQPSRIQSISTSGTPAGAITVKAGTLTMADSALIRSTSGSTGQGGDVTATAPTIILDSLSSITARTQAPGNAGNVTVNTNNLNLLNGGTVDTSATPTDGFLGDPATFVTGNAGSIQVNALGGSLTITGNGSVRSLTTTTGNAGQVILVSPALNLNNATITTSTSGTGSAGSVTITTTGNTLSLSNGSRISSASTGTMANAGDAGSVTIMDSGSFTSNASTVATSAENAKGGDISITAQSVQLLNGTSISASSNAPLLPNGEGDAGNIRIDSASTFVMKNSSITTEASQASGGQITINAPARVQLTNSTVSTSVAGIEGDTTGGDITIDPNFVILQNSQIIAQAFAGTGGNITITAGVFLADPNSLVDASSQLGISGTIDIQAPVQNLSGALVPLSQGYLAATSLLAQRCAARHADGQFSTFVVAGRDGLPLEPGGLLPISTYVRAPGAGTKASATDTALFSQLASASLDVPKLSDECIR
jgi:large exoprotein involved in heme utilization and adhesion